MSLASFTGAGLTGVRLTRKKQVIKGVPRIANTHTKETYWLFRDLTAEVGTGEVLAMLSRDPDRTTAAMRVWAGLSPVDEGSASSPPRSLLVTAPQARWVRALSVQQTIRVVAGIYGLTDDEVEQIVPLVARTAQVDSMLNWPIENVQKGFRAQIAFAIGVHAPADLVMFDYTAYVGNHDYRPLCVNHIKAMREAGKTVVLATDKPTLVLEAATSGLIVRSKRSEHVPVAEAAEFLIRGRVKGRKKARRRVEEEDDDGLDF